MLHYILKTQKIRNCNFTEKRWYNKNAERKVDEKWTTISMNGGDGISRTKRWDARRKKDESSSMLFSPLPQWTITRRRRRNGKIIQTLIDSSKKQENSSINWTKKNKANAFVAEQVDPHDSESCGQRHYGRPISFHHTYHWLSHYYSFHPEYRIGWSGNNRVDHSAEVPWTSAFLYTLYIFLRPLPFLSIKPTISKQRHIVLFLLIDGIESRLYSSGFFGRSHPAKWSFWGVSIKWFFS